MSSESIEAAGRAYQPSPTRPPADRPGDADPSRTAASTQVGTVGAARPPVLRQHILGLQRTAGNLAVGTILQRDRLKDLEDRTKVLEKKAEAANLDLKYRAEFGKKTSNYKQIVYRLTGGFQTAINGFNSAQTQQAAQDAVIDQVVTTLILVGGAAVLEPFLTVSLGKLQGALGKASSKIAKISVKDVVEKIENPANAAASGAGNAITTNRQGNRAAANQPPTGAGPAVPGKGGDPLTFLSSNLEAIEQQAQSFEQAFSTRAATFDTLTPEQWAQWDRTAQEKIYTDLLAELDTLALGDVAKLEQAQTLAVKIELYLWAGWIKSHVAGVKGLQIGSQLATRLKALGVESLAGVTFDTSSWVFMDHQPHGTWESNLRNWARDWAQSITTK